MRNDFFDFSKGILILLVILGHAINYCAVDEYVWLNPIYNIIYTFHMPLFVFLSGYFFFTCLKRTFIEVFNSRFKRLIIPEILNSGIIFILFSFISRFQYESLYQIYDLTKSYWFLICIFTLTIIYYLIFKLKRLGVYMYVCMYVCALIYYDSLPGYILKDCQVIRMFLIFGIGAIIGYRDRCMLKFIKNNKHWLYILTPISILVIVLDRNLYGFDLMAYPPIIRIIDGIVCSNIALLIFYALYLLCFKYNQKIISLMVEHGKQSLCLYLAHMILSRPLFMNDIFIFKEISTMNVICVFFIYYIFSLFYTYGIKNRWFNKLFLGRY